MKAENDFLSRKVDILSRELRVLKDIFMSHASNAHGTRITEYDLTLLTGGGSGSSGLDSHFQSHSSVAAAAAAAAAVAVPTYAHERRHSPEPLMRDPLYLSPSHRRYPASLSLSSGSSIQDSEDDM